MHSWSLRQRYQSDPSRKERGIGWGTLSVSGAGNCFTTSAMSLSWKRRMAAMPAAPASRQERSVRQGDPAQGQDWDFAWQASLRRSRPAGCASFFSKTGAKTAKVASLAGGFDYFCWGVTGDSDQGILW